MTMEQPQQPSSDTLLTKAVITEQPFHSEVPLLGPLIARLRGLWNSVSTKWYVRPLLQQQNDFNLAVARRLEFMEEYLYEQSSAQDRDLTSLRRETAELQVALSSLQRHQQALEQQLAKLEQERFRGNDGAAPR